MDELFDINGELIIKNRLSNKLTGKYKLYKQVESDIESEITIMKPDEGSLNSFMWVRTQKNYELPASMQIMYRGNEQMQSSIEAVAGEYLEVAIQVRPYNRLFGKFELLEAPRKEVKLHPIADASTRSRSDLRTINYGDTKSMLVGKNTEEKFESFIDFGKLIDRIPDIKVIENATLRLYYIDFPIGSIVELHQPNTIWRELGITDANKPYSTQLLLTDYSINTVERYIEFDVTDIVNKWESGDLLNYGLNIKTPEDKTLNFFTRESQRSPVLIVSYITSQIYSVGRSQLDGSLFINGKGFKDINGSLTVHSDVGLDYQEATLYVHRYADPLFTEVNSRIGNSKPDILSEFVVAHRGDNSFKGSLTISNKATNEKTTDLSVNVPDLYLRINVDPNAFLHSEIAIARRDISDANGWFKVSQPDIGASLQISNYTRNNYSLESFLTVKNTKEEENEGKVVISSPDLWGGLTVRAAGEDSLESTFDIPYYSNNESDIGVNRPNLPASMLIKYINQIDAEILVKEREFLDSIIDVKQINELSGFLIARQKEEKDGNMIINTPDLFSIIQPRVIGQEDLDVVASIRKRDVSDLNSSLIIRGKSNGSYWFIY